MAKPHHRREQQQAVQQQHAPEPEQLPLANAERVAASAEAEPEIEQQNAPQVTPVDAPTQFSAPTGVYPAPPGPGVHAFVITPSDSTALTRRTKVIYVGGAGNISLIASGDDPAGAAVVFTAVPVGTQLQIDALYVHATGTTATLLVGIG